MVRRCFFICLLATALLVFFLASPLGAVSTVDCHCFRERSFTPENPSAFDPYLLATVQNRFLAHAFNLSRKEIVSEKMSGASGEGLWVLHWLARNTDLGAHELKALYRKAESWRKVVFLAGGDPERLGSQFMAALAKDDEQDLARAVVNQVFMQSLGVDEKRLAELNNRGATLKETIIASLLALLNEEDSLQLFNRAHQNGSWGSVTVAVGTTVETLETFLAQRFSRPSEK